MTGLSIKEFDIELRMSENLCSPDYLPHAGGPTVGPTAKSQMTGKSQKYLMRREVGGGDGRRGVMG